MEKQIKKVNRIKNFFSRNRTTPQPGEIGSYEKAFPKKRKNILSICEKR